MSTPLKRRSRRGNAALEFALTFPVMLAIFAATVEYSVYLTHMSAISQAAKDSMRLAAPMTTAEDPVGEATLHARDLMLAMQVPCDIAACSISVSLDDDDTLPLISIHIEVGYDRLFAGLVPAPDVMIHDYTMLWEGSAIRN